MTTKKPKTVTAGLACVVLAGLVLFAAARPSAADAPAGRFTVSAGTVTDTMTGLVWQQAVPNSSFTWAQAGAYCANNTAALPGSNWRLPSLTEAQTIVDDSRSNPAVDPTAFPSTPVYDFWTSTTTSNGYVWTIGMDQGGTAGSLMTALLDVRCVR